MLLAASAFSALGLLLGLMAGLTSSPVTVTLIGALFAFVGGSAATYFGKLSADHLRLATMALLFLSLFMTVGLFGGIVIKVNRLLEFRVAAETSAKDGSASRDAAVTRTPDRPEPILRSNSAGLMQDLTERVSSGNLKLGEACQTVLQRGEDRSAAGKTDK